MKPVSQNADSTSCQALRLHRKLIELDEFAHREGISVDDIEQCSNIGAIQLRKHKGKTYVLDMPVCSYDNSDKIDNEVAELIGLKSNTKNMHKQLERLK